MVDWDPRESTPLGSATKRLKRIARAWTAIAAVGSVTALAQNRAPVVGNASEPMVLVPGSYFDMGDPFDEGSPDEVPVHTVWVSTFRIGIYELTNARYVDFLNAGGNDDHWDPGQRINQTGDPNNPYYEPDPNDANHPVVYVNWEDAMAFCDWRSEAEGLPIGTYRLPTEAEWEKAAAWDPALPYHFRFGEHTDGCGYDCLDGQRANYYNSGDPFDNGTTPVGYYDGSDHGGTYQTQNAQSYYGCYDMSGNVWDWCYDWYDPDYYDTSPENDPTGPASGTSRVQRAGAWSENLTPCRSADRAWNSPEYRGPNLSFRVAASAHDCNDNGIPDFADMENCDGSPWCDDCNANDVLDVCDIDPNDPDGNGAVSEDCQPNGVPDECDVDPNNPEAWQDCIWGGPDGIPDQCQCIGDHDGDGDVDLSDLAELLSHYGMTSGATTFDGDLDCDGDVDLSDLAALLAVYGTTCE